MTFNKAKETVKHLEGCQYEKRNIPIDECICDCYEYHFYKAGLNEGNKHKTNKG